MRISFNWLFLKSMTLCIELRMNLSIQYQHTLKLVNCSLYSEGVNLCLYIYTATMNKLCLMSTRWQYTHYSWILSLFTLHVGCNSNNPDCGGLVASYKHVHIM
jgi:hypothetical protein